jgi:LacI family transcriptional regulator
VTRQKVRLADIAAKTGYGTNTVSLALRGSTRISAAARKIIVNTAEELEYIPNHIAKALVSRRSKTVGLILHEITNPILTSAAEKIQVTLAARGYGMLFATANGSFEDELRAIDAFRSRMIDGLLIYPVRHARLDHLKRLRDLHFPVVLLVGIAEAGIDAVGIDEYAGAYEATAHLVREGHRRIGVVVTPQYETTQKFSGYQEALASAGLSFDPDIVGYCLSHSIEAGIKAADTIMASPDRPTAIFATSDILALGVLRWASMNRVKVPQELAIVGFDDIDSARYAATSLSTINNDVAELAKRSVARLMELIDANGALPPPTSDLLHGQLVVRESTHVEPVSNVPDRLV